MTEPTQSTARVLVAQCAEDILTRARRSKAYFTRFLPVVLPSLCLLFLALCFLEFLHGVTSVTVSKGATATAVLDYAQIIGMTALMDVVICFTAMFLLLVLFVPVAWLVYDLTKCATAIGYSLLYPVPQDHFVFANRYERRLALVVHRPLRTYRWTVLIAVALCMVACAPRIYEVPRDMVRFLGYLAVCLPFLVSLITWRLCRLAIARPLPRRNLMRRYVFSRESIQLDFLWTLFLLLFFAILFRRLLPFVLQTVHTVSTTLSDRLTASMHLLEKKDAILASLTPTKKVQWVQLLPDPHCWSYIHRMALEYVSGFTTSDIEALLGFAFLIPTLTGISITIPKILHFAKQDGTYGAAIRRILAGAGKAVLLSVMVQFLLKHAYLVNPRSTISTVTAFSFLATFFIAHQRDIISANKAPEGTARKLAAPQR